MEKGLGVDFMRLLIWQPHGSRISVRGFPTCITTLQTTMHSHGKSLVTFAQGSIFRMIDILARDSGLLLEWLGQLSGGFDVAFVGFAALFGI